MLADQRAQQAGLADAVAAEHAGDLARLGFERNAAQRLRRAVVEIDGIRASSIASFRDAASRTRIRCTRASSGSRFATRNDVIIAPNTLRSRARCADTWSMVPSASTEPSCRQVTLTPSSRTKAMSCSTTTTVLSRLISFSSSAVCMRLGVGHAGDRLVDQQQFRLLRQQHADLQPLLLAVRQAAGDARAQRLEPDGARGCASMRASCSAVLAPQQGRARAPVVLQRQQQIVLDRVHLEHGRLLEFAADAELGDLRLVELGQIVARPARKTRRRRPAGSCR